MIRFDLIGTPTSAFGLAFERTVRAESFRARIAAIGLSLALIMGVLVVENVRLFVSKSHLADVNDRINVITSHQANVLALGDEVKALQLAQKSLHDLRRSAAKNAADLSMIRQELGGVRVDSILDSGQLWTLSGKARSVDELATAEEALSGLTFVKSAITTSGSDNGIVTYSLRIEKGHK